MCRTLLEKKLNISSDGFIPMKFLEYNENESYLDIIIEVFYNSKKYSYCITQFLFNGTFYIEEMSVKDIDTYSI